MVDQRGVAVAGIEGEAPDLLARAGQAQQAVAGQAAGGGTARPEKRWGGGCRSEPERLTMTEAGAVGRSYLAAWQTVIDLCRHRNYAEPDYADVFAALETGVLRSA